MNFPVHIDTGVFYQIIQNQFLEKVAHRLCVLFICQSNWKFPLFHQALIYVKIKFWC
jgi:hypothetical protein